VLTHYFSIFPPLVRGQNSPVIIFLPTGPVLDESCFAGVDDGEIIKTLSAASNAHIVRLNYRLGAGVHYPSPVHDVLSGYDWVKENLSPSSTSNRSSLLRIGVCGQLVGGSLATMLALTESRMGEGSVAAAAVNAPVVDWVFPEPDFIESENESDNERGDLVEDDSAPRNFKFKSKKKLKKPTSWELYRNNAALPASFLLNARSKLFRRPAHYFDPFASPTLFFRSPGADVPIPVTDFPSEEEDDAIETVSTTRRKVHRTFPPTASSLRLPDMRISVGYESPLYDQNEELVRLLRRSIFRRSQKQSSQVYDRFEEESSEEEMTKSALADAERRIEFHVPSQTGIWGLDSNPAWRTDVMEAGTWLRKALS
jgi:acetyl esterase/lipase